MRTVESLGGTLKLQKMALNILLKRIMRDYSRISEWHSEENVDGISIVIKYRLYDFEYSGDSLDAIRK